MIKQIITFTIFVFVFSPSPSQVCLRTIETGAVVSLCFAPGDRHILAGLQDGKLLIIDISAGDILEEIQAHAAEIWSISLLPAQVCYSFVVYSKLF